MLFYYRFASKKCIVNGEYFVDYIYVRITAKITVVLPLQYAVSYKQLVRSVHKIYLSQK